MSDQRHRICRQIFEIQVPDAGSAWALQNTLSRLQTVEIERLLDACLSQHCPPDTVLRIDRLELDLGALRPGALAQDLIAKLGPALGKALQQHATADETGPSSDDPRSQSQLELLSHFAATGQVPWWADARQPRLLATALGIVLDDRRSATREILRALLRTPAHRLRLIQHLDDATLLPLLRGLAEPGRRDSGLGAADLDDALGILLPRLQQSGEAALGLPASRLRQALSLATLQLLTAPDPRTRDNAETWRELLAHWALAADLTSVALATGLAALLPTVAARTSLPPALQRLLPALPEPPSAIAQRQAEALHSPPGGESPAQQAEGWAAQYSPPLPSAAPPPSPPVGRGSASPASPQPCQPPPEALHSPPGRLLRNAAAAKKPSPPGGEVGGEADGRGGQRMEPTPLEVPRQRGTGTSFNSLPEGTDPTDDPSSTYLSPYQSLADSASHSPSERAIHSQANVGNTTASDSALLSELHSGPEIATAPLPEPRADSVGQPPELDLTQAAVGQPIIAHTDTQSTHESTGQSIAQSIDQSIAIDPSQFSPLSVSDSVSDSVPQSFPPLLTTADASPDVDDADGLPPLLRLAAQLRQVSAMGTANGLGSVQAALQLLEGLAADGGSQGWPTSRLQRLRGFLPRLRSLAVLPVATLRLAATELDALIQQRPPLPTSSPTVRGNLGQRPARDSEAAAERRRDPAPSRVDEAYVTQAGLVFLWPFLPSLFENLGLIFRGQFVDAPARHRAVGLLHHLATGELIPLEYQLTLAKVLCGLDDAEPLDFGEPVTDAEAGECDALLHAAIAHAAVLGDLPIASFRELFLQREGVLSSRGESLLLRVERTPHSALIERFPWPTRWIRLPWGPLPLYVEW